MTLAEIIEKRGHKYNEHIGRTSAADWYAGYMLGWKWAYQDLKEILEQNGFDMNVEVMPVRSNMSESDYYWAKAEFQDPVEHRRHVDSYKRGFPDAYYFDEQYRKEALDELYNEYKQSWCESRGYKLEDMNEEVGINGECYACFGEWYSNEYMKQELHL